MQITDKDHLIAVLTPGAFVCASFLLTWQLIFLMPLLYFVYRKLALPQAKDSTLKVFDLTVSLLLIGAVVGGFVAGLTVVARDGEFAIAGISDGLIVAALSLLGFFYYLGCLLLLSVKTYQRKPYTPKLSMEIFEALRGKRASSGNTTTP